MAKERAKMDINIFEQRIYCSHDINPRKLVHTGGDGALGTILTKTIGLIT